MELGGPLSRPQHRLQRRKVQDRRRVQRRHTRCSSACDRLHGESQRLNRRRSSRLQLAGRQLGGRRRSRHPDVGARRNADLCVPRRDLQSDRRLRRAGDGELQSRSQTGFVRQRAGARRHHHHARCDRLCHRRPRRWLDPNHPQPVRRRVRRRGQRRRGQRAVQRLGDQAGLDGRRRRRGPPVRQCDWQGRIPLHGFRHRLGIRHEWSERDADCARHQLAHHRQRRAGRRQLQVRSRRWRL
jgi:hypothetical protein